MSPGWESLARAGSLPGLILTNGGSPGSAQSTTFRRALIHRIILIIYDIYPYAQIITGHIPPP